jgi:Mrp family chromosome partitioning ATPase
MLEALKRAEVPDVEGQAAPSAGAAPQLQIVGADDPGDEMPYIEVGGRGRAVEASPGLLIVTGGQPAAAGAAPERVAPAITAGGPAGVAFACGAVPAEPHASPRAPALTVPVPMTVAFQPCPGVPEPCLRVAPEVIASHQPDHEVSKQYRALLARVLPTPAGATGDVLLFTALAPAAGVTTALLNLAVSACAADGRAVVAVDVNLRRPALAGRLGLAAGPGVSELLAGRAALEQAVRRTAQDRLHALTAGAAAAPGVAITAEAVRWVVAWLRERFDAVFLDGPTWAEGAEMAALVSAADQVLLLLDRGDATEPRVRAAGRAVARMGGRLAGVLVTG